jgi:tRNA(Phe) wybutosine-synthesizing methylase Tyw3
LLGHKNKGEWIAKNHKNIEIENLNDPLLKMKSFVFFKKV